MEHLKQTCKCGWSGSGDKCAESCPKCGGIEVLNEIDHDAPAVNDTRPSREIQMPNDRNTFQEGTCHYWRGDNEE